MDSKQYPTVKMTFLLLTSPVFKYLILSASVLLHYYAFLYYVSFQPDPIKCKTSLYYFILNVLSIAILLRCVMPHSLNLLSMGTEFEGGEWGGIWVKRLSLLSMAQTVIAYVGMDENAWARTTSIVWGSEGCRSRCCPLGPGFGIRIESGYEYRDIVPSRAPADPPDKRPRRERKKRTGKAILLQRMHSSVHPLRREKSLLSFWRASLPHLGMDNQSFSTTFFSRSFSYIPT